MILATVGTQLPFPRLLRALDRIAQAHRLKVIAQTCGDLPEARAIEQHAFFDPAAFAALAGESRMIVGHAGIGTIFAAARAEKPLVLFPRRANLGEHRNDHQLATAAAVEARPGIHVAWDEEALERFLISTELAPLRPAEAPTLPRLVATVRSFVTLDRHPGTGPADLDRQSRAIR